MAFNLQSCVHLVIFSASNHIFTSNYICRFKKNKKEQNKHKTYKSKTERKVIACISLKNFVNIINLNEKLNW